MSEEKKIIIDEDWKSQVEAEKQAEAEKKAAAQQPPSAEPTPGEPPASAVGAEEPAGATPPTDVGGSPGEAAGSPDDPAMPPASIHMLVTSLATEAMLSMGLMPHPATGETVTRRNQAKYLIDTIEVLKEKTAGNLAPEESAAIEDMLHQLRLAFVQTR